MADQLAPEVIDDAKALLDSNAAFMHAVAKLRKHWFAELMALDAASPYYSQAIMALTSKMQALEAIPRELAIMLTNFHHDQRHSRSTPSVSPKTTRPGEIQD